MKKLFVALLALGTFCASATQVQVSGRVEKVKTFSLTTTADSGTVAGDSWVKLDNLTSAGNCPAVGTHGVIFYIPKADSRVLETLLSAQNNGRKVEVQIDDSVMYHNACVVDALSIL